MAVLELDLTDKANPPADDLVKAPHGWMWDRPAKRWRPRKKVPTGGWMGRRAEPKPADKVGAHAEPPLDMGPFERDVAGDDPPPAYATSRPPKLPKAAPPRVTAKTKGDMTAAVGLVGMLVLPPIVRADPFCGQALTDNFQGIADAVVPLLCRSAKVVEFFTEEASDWMLWFKLAVALAPVVVAFGQHHVLKTVKVVQDTDDDGKPTGDLYAVSTRPADLDTEYPA
jgi:hypothetical protein